MRQSNDDFVEKRSALQDFFVGRFIEFRLRRNLVYIVEEQTRVCSMYVHNTLLWAMTIGSESEFRYGISTSWYGPKNPPYLFIAIQHAHGISD